MVQTILSLRIRKRDAQFHDDGRLKYLSKVRLGLAEVVRARRSVGERAEAV